MVRTRARQCDGKQRHPDSDGARLALASLVRRRGANPTRFQVYRCRFCAGWHIGHRAKLRTFRKK